MSSLSAGLKIFGSIEDTIVVFLFAFLHNSYVLQS